MRFSILLLTLSLFVSAPWAARASTPQEAELECNDALKNVPNPDLVSQWMRKYAPKLEAWLTRMNASFPPEKRLTEAQIKNVLRQSLFFDISDYETIVDLVEGRQEPAPELLEPLETWLRALADEPLPSRATLEAREPYYAYPSVQWPGTWPKPNLVQLGMRGRLSARLSTLEARLGQKVFDDDELSYYSSSFQTYAEMERLIGLYESKKPPASAPILEIKRKVGIVTEALRNSYRRAEPHSDPIGTDELAIAIALRNDPRINAELDYYVQRATTVKGDYLAGLRPDSLAAFRMRQWRSDGPPSTMQRSIEDRVLAVVKESVTYLSSANKNYHPTVSHYSISTTLGDERAEKGESGLKDALASLRWGDAQVKYLGNLRMLKPSQSFLGFKLGEDDPNLRRIDVFGVDVPSGNKGVRRFAVQAIPTYVGDEVPFSETTYAELDGLKIEEVRGVTTEARVQDAFRTTPTALKEPMLVLKRSTGSYFEAEPNQLLIQELRVRPGEEDSGTEMTARARAITIKHFGGSDKPEAIFYAFKNYAQLGLPFKFELASSDETHETYVYQGKSSSLMTERWVLERNLVTQEIKLTFSTYAGIGKFQVVARRWVGEFGIP